jgi:hypothetical protein
VLDHKPIEQESEVRLQVVVAIRETTTDDPDCARRRELTAPLER